MTIALFYLSILVLFWLIWLVFSAWSSRRRILRAFKLLVNLWGGSVILGKDYDPPIYCFEFQGVSCQLIVYERPKRPIFQRVLSFLLDLLVKDKAQQEAEQRRWGACGLFTECSCRVKVDRINEFYLIHVNESWVANGQTAHLAEQLLASGGEEILQRLALHFPGSRVDCGYDGLYVTVRVDKWLALVTDFSNLRQACYDLKVLALEVIAKNS